MGESKPRARIQFPRSKHIALWVVGSQCLGDASIRGWLDVRWRARCSVSVTFSMREATVYEVQWEGHSTGIIFPSSQTIKPECPSVSAESLTTPTAQGGTDGDGLPPAFDMASRRAEIAPDRFKGHCCSRLRKADFRVRFLQSPRPL